jgi:hypothetical protein
MSFERVELPSRALTLAENKAAIAHKKESRSLHMNGRKSVSKGSI